MRRRGLTFFSRFSARFSACSRGVGFLGIGFLGCGLVGCTREGDTFSPQVVIVQPAAGAITQKPRLEVRGYAWDDAGIAKLVVNGKDLLANGEPFARQRGQKLVRFNFIASTTGSGSVDYEFRVTDVNGREGKRMLPLIVDNTLPNLKEGLTCFEAGGNTVSVTATAEDNIKVAKIFVNGVPLNVSPGKSVSFFHELRRTRTLTLVIEDSVGNRLERSFRSPEFGLRICH